MTDGTGVTTYSYNPITTPPMLGAGRLASTDGPLDNDSITYSYDELGRVTNRSINGAANAASVQYDSLGRVQNVTNLLGSFNYAYVNTTGRLDHVDLPNSQKVQYSYFDNLGDQRLKQIKNLDPSVAVISQFDYTYNAVGNILTWTQANSGTVNPKRYDFGYDGADQLRNANLTDTVTNAVANQFNYDYDSAGNRTNSQIGSAITSSTTNNLNQIASQSAGGKMHFRGTVDEAATVTVAGTPATVDAQGNFDGVANVNVGSNTVAVTATDATSNTRTNNYQVNVPSGTGTSLIYDLSGNLTNDGSRTYEWDAANRCIAINQGSHRTEVSYDGHNREASRLEKENGVVVSTQRFVWCGMKRCEERDASNVVTKRFYEQGEQIGASNYFFTKDHLGSVREMTDGSSVVQVRYDYDPYGVRIKTNGVMDSDFGFTSHYVNSQYSDLTFAPLRIYNSQLGRWITRDPISEAGGINVYAYVDNDPINSADALGLFSCDQLRAMLAREIAKLISATNDANDWQSQLTRIINTDALQNGLLNASGVLGLGSSALIGVPLLGFAGFGSTPWVVGTASITSTTTVMSSSFLFLTRTQTTLRNTALTANTVSIAANGSRWAVKLLDSRTMRAYEEAEAALAAAMDAREAALNAAEAIKAAMNKCDCK